LWAAVPETLRPNKDVSTRITPRSRPHEHSHLETSLPTEAA
jgi:hypothetical protein